MKNLMRISAGAALLAIAGACASQPDPEPVAPVVAEPEPTPPPVEEVVEAPREVAPRVATGPLRGSVEDFVVNAGERVYFDYDQWRLDDDDKSVLRRQATWLQSYPGVRILVAGNCDERGTREYNLALGERRASIVRDYLVSLGVDGARIETVSYGKERPIDARSNPAGWAVNRNGHTQIVSGARS